MMCNENTTQYSEVWGISICLHRSFCLSVHDRGEMVLWSFQFWKLVVVTAVLFQCADNHSQSTSTHQFSKHYVQQQSRYLMSKLSVGEDMWFSERTICLTQRRECVNRVLELNYFIGINAMFDKWKMTNFMKLVQFKFLDNVHSLFHKCFHLMYKWLITGGTIRRFWNIRISPRSFIPITSTNTLKLVASECPFLQNTIPKSQLYDVNIL